jgi:hypothetical protein
MWTVSMENSRRREEMFWAGLTSALELNFTTALTKPFLLFKHLTEKFNLIWCSEVFG